MKKLLNGNSRSNGMSSLYPGMACLLLALAAFLVLPAALVAQDTIVYDFQGPNASPMADGAFPNGGLVADPSGNLYGTTAGGGNYGIGCPDTGCGVLYKLTPTSGGFPYTETVLYYFQGCGGVSCGSPSDGATPQDTLIIDKYTNLYGTTSQGGEGCNTNTGCGTVFVFCQVTAGPYCSILPLGENVLAVMSPSSSNGRHPYAPLVMDQYFNLYGTNIAGNVNTNCSALGYPGCGTVFVVCAPAAPATTPAPCTPAAPSFSYHEIYYFTGIPDGSNPYGGMVMSAKGILYGTTASGGLANSGPEPCTRYIEASVEPGCGTVFRLVPSGGATWNETVLYSFKGYAKDGSYPQGSLIADLKGDLYGTTDLGPLGGGTVFEIKNGSTITEKILFKFTNRWDGGNIYAGVTFDNNYKTLYGATYSGGGANNGSVFELDLSGATWIEPASTSPVPSAALWSFFPNSAMFGQCVPSSTTGGDGCNPFANVIPIQVSNGAGGTTKYLFGTTYAGGNGGPSNPTGFNQGYGTVYAVQP
jgi:uncharacterized repeat protein (TIGR03803 family)